MSRLSAYHRLSPEVGRQLAYWHGGRSSVPLSALAVDPNRSLHAGTWQSAVHRLKGTLIGYADPGATEHIGYLHPVLVNQSKMINTPENPIRDLGGDWEEHIPYGRGAYYLNNVEDRGGISVVGYMPDALRTPSQRIQMAIDSGLKSEVHPETLRQFYEGTLDAPEKIIIPKDFDSELLPYSVPTATKDIWQRYHRLAPRRTKNVMAYLQRRTVPLDQILPT